MLKDIFRRRKTIEQTLQATTEEGFTLKRELSALDLVILGVGIIIGAGIFVLTGVAAATEAGPAITLSFAFAALVCVFVALCYGEFASLVPAAGSAYTYAYATLGELIAFIIGWDLILELVVGASVVAIGWSGYLNATLNEIFGVTLPASISRPPGEGGVINLTGIALVLFLTFFLVRGVKITARANAVMVAVIVGVLLLVVIAGAPEIDTANWSPYFPFGFDGVISGAALVFFAFIGFDTIATMAEEAHNPKRDMPIGIIGSLGVTSVLYILVSAVITGMVVYTSLNSEAPIADAFKNLDEGWIAALIFAGALTALTNTVLIIMLSIARLTFAMSRDFLFPRSLARTHPRFGTPHRITLIIGFLVALLTGFTPITVAAELVNIGALFVFIVVSAGVIVLRIKQPTLERPFRTPFVPLVPALAVILCAVLIATLAPLTWLRFVVWMVVGLIVYFGYSAKRSTLA